MQFRDVSALRGPNVWARFPVLEVEVDLGELKDASSDAMPGFNERLKSWLPSLIEHRCSVGQRGGFLKRLERGTYLAHVLEHVTLELQSLAGTEVGFGRARETDADGVYRVAIEYEEEEVGRAALELGRRICLAAVHDQPIDIPAEIGRLRELASNVKLGPSTAAIVRAAHARGIPTRRLNRDSFVQLGHAAHAHRIVASETDQTSAIAEQVAQDKDLTRSLLRAIGIPSPEGRPVEDAEDAWRAAEELGLPVVVKPRYGNHGRGVSTNLRTKEQVLAAYENSRAESSYVLVERYLEGADYRLLVIGGRLVAASLREPAQVRGDGRSTIRQLVEEVNRDPRRGEGHANVLSKIQLDTIALSVLEEQGYSPESVPADGERVLLRRIGNLSTGGTAEDVTDRVHPQVAARAIDAAAVVGLDVAGVDVVATDISQPLETQGGGIVEVNAGPGLRMHLEPSSGQPRPVGQAIVDQLFPLGETGRIPIISVTGVNGKTTTCYLIAHIMKLHGWRVGLTCTHGMYVQGRRISTKDCSGPRSAKAMLVNPSVDAAVFETARGGILREGLGYDRANVGVITNIGHGDHLGRAGIRTAQELAYLKSTVIDALLPGGWAVLNAADPLVVDVAQYARGSIVYFAREGGDSVIQPHLDSRGRAVLVGDDRIVLMEGGRKTDLLPLAEVRCTHGGRVSFQVENALAAAAATWALGLPLDVIRQGLATFEGNANEAPGRFNVFSANGATVVVDFAHNLSAVEALVEGLKDFPHRRRLAVYASLDRRDQDIAAIGKVLGDNFDLVLLYRYGDAPDARDLELHEILHRNIAAGSRVLDVSEAPTERDAVQFALDALEPGDLLVIGPYEIGATLDYVRQHLLKAAEVIVVPSQLSLASA
jgi:cyanophycin synthetase